MRVRSCWRDLRLEEGIHLVCPINLHVSDMLILRWELDCEVFEVVVLRHA